MDLSDEIYLLKSTTLSEWGIICGIFWINNAAALRPLSISEINSLALISLINQWFPLVKGLLLSLLYKTLNKECNEVNSGETVSIGGKRENN